MPAYNAMFHPADFTGNSLDAWTEKTAEYRAHEARCLGLAEDKSDARIAHLYLMAAAQWRALADAAERETWDTSDYPSLRLPIAPWSE